MTRAWTDAELRAVYLAAFGDPCSDEAWWDGCLGELRRVLAAPTTKARIEVVAWWSCGDLDMARDSVSKIMRAAKAYAKKHPKGEQR